MLLKHKDYRKLGVPVVLKHCLWLKSLPWSMTWAFPLRSAIISQACGEQPNPSSSKWCGQQSVRCDHQLITHYPPDQAQPLHRCEASVVLNILSGRSAVEGRLPQTGFVRRLLRVTKLSPLVSQTALRSLWESPIRLTFELRLNYFRFKVWLYQPNFFLIERNALFLLLQWQYSTLRAKNIKWDHLVNLTLRVSHFCS